jgi:hypothetical protein
MLQGRMGYVPSIMLRSAGFTGDAIISTEDVVGSEGR